MKLVNYLTCIKFNIITKHFYTIYVAVLQPSINIISPMFVIEEAS